MVLKIYLADPHPKQTLNGFLQLKKEVFEFTCLQCLDRIGQTTKFDAKDSYFGYLSEQ